MNEQIKKINKWLPWLIAVSGVLFIGLFVSYFHPGRFYWSYIEPWESACNVSIYKAIHSFSSTNTGNIYLEQRIGALVGILILFVVGPSLWIFSETKNESLKSSPEKKSIKRGWKWYAGVMIIMAGFYYSISGSISKLKNLQMSHTITKQHQIKNELRQELIMRAIQVLQFYYLPVARGGGGKSFRMLTTTDHPKPVGSGQSTGSSQPNQAFIYHSEKTDNMLTIYAIGNIEGRNPGFKNADGERGKMQLAIQIIPAKKNMIRWIRNDRFIN